MTPTSIKLHRRSQVLEVCFASACYRLSAEYLRVFSPSAEVKGHGPGQETLPRNKADVAIVAVEPQGNYAVKLSFSDRHDSGIYTWAYLRDLGVNYARYWQEYQEKLARQSDEDCESIRWVAPSPAKPVQQ